MTRKKIKYLPNELKQEIEVAVSLYYSFQKEYASDILSIAKILEGYGLKPVISDGYYYGESKDLVCKGSVDLLNAEKICYQLDSIPTHASITYSDGRFFLTE